MKPHTDTWSRLARLAQAAPPDSPDLPFGLSTRIIAQWRGLARESSIDVLEWLVLRGMAVALLILLACSVVSYEAISGATGGQTALAGSWLEDLLTL